MSTTTTNQLAVVTGASTGIGLALARICSQNGFDLIIAANEPEIETAASELRQGGAKVEAVQADLATTEGVDQLCDRIKAGGRPVDALLANAGRGLGKGFLDQDFSEIRDVIETNVFGTTYLVHKVGRDMRARNHGRILLTGSIAGFIPGSFQAVYNASKSYVNSFALALRNELKETDITVTVLMPGPTETEFFERAHMLDTDVGQAKKDDPADVAEVGFEAMMKGQADTASGWKNKLQSALANVTPQGILAEQHRKMAEPGSGKH